MVYRSTSLESNTEQNVQFSYAWRMPYLSMFIDSDVPTPSPPLSLSPSLSLSLSCVFALPYKKSVLGTGIRYMQTVDQPVLHGRCG